MPSPVKEPFTYHDLENFPDDGKRREIVDGELYVTAAPNTRHQKLVGELFGLIWLYLRQHHAGHAFLAPTEVDFADQTVVQPDICVIVQQSQAVITEKRIVGAPDWIIEVLSPSTYDYDLETKRKLYLRYGVVYWAIDSVDETILIWDGHGRQIFTGHDTVSPSVLAGFHLTVAELFAALQ